MDLRDHWESLQPETKSRLVWWGSGLGLVLLITSTYYFSGRSEKVIEAPVEETEVTLGTQLLEDDIRAEVDSKLSVQDQLNQDNDLRLKAVESLVSELQIQGQGDESIELGSTLALEEEGIEKYPPAPAVFPEQVDLLATPPVEVHFIGAIGRSNGNPQPKPDDGKKNGTFLMPPGFMPAVLLTGLEALTTSAAREDQEPMLFRVQAPAVLPNDLKANLQGCFVVGNGFGSLAKERIDVRTVSLHCVALDGTGVIDEEIKGFVVDEDGKKGLAGIVSTKMGALVSRAMLASAADGIGQAISLDTVTQSVNPLGATNVVDPDRAIQAGIGQGIKGGAGKIQELFLELARQSGPVIEAGATKQCAIVIQEAVEIEVKEWSGAVF